MNFRRNIFGAKRIELDTNLPVVCRDHNIWTTVSDLNAITAYINDLNAITAYINDSTAELSESVRCSMKILSQNNKRAWIFRLRATGEL